VSVRPAMDKHGSVWWRTGQRTLEEPGVLSFIYFTSWSERLVLQWMALHILR